MGDSGDYPRGKSKTGGAHVYRKYTSAIMIAEARVYKKF